MCGVMGVVEDVVRYLRKGWYARGNVTVVHIVMGTHDIFTARASSTKKAQYLYVVQRFGDDAPAHRVRAP